MENDTIFMCQECCEQVQANFIEALRDGWPCCPKEGCEGASDSMMLTSSDADVSLIAKTALCLAAAVPSTRDELARRLVRQVEIGGLRLLVDGGEEDDPA